MCYVKIWDRHEVYSSFPILLRKQSKDTPHVSIKRQTQALGFIMNTTRNDESTRQKDNQQADHILHHDTKLTMA